MHDYFFFDTATSLASRRSHFNLQVFFRRFRGISGIETQSQIATSASANQLARAMVHNLFGHFVNRYAKAKGSARFAQFIGIAELSASFTFAQDSGT